MLGSTDEIGEILDRTRARRGRDRDPFGARASCARKVVAACRERDIPVRTLPTVFELLRGGVQLTRQLREVRVEDVLGRDPVVMELDRVGAYLEDKIVLVTGAGGSIGAELCRQIARVRPKLLVLLDHAEDNLFRIDREMVDEWHFTRVEAVLADCKEGERMLEVMQRFKPDVVFHAAAYKHVPLMEANPARGGAQQRDRHPGDGGDGRGRRRRAVRADLHRQGGQPADRDGSVEGDGRVDRRGGRPAPSATPASSIVRFGNVLASSGSVVPIFRSQIEQGGPVTVTHPEMTRYFMTIPEAVQLVIQAGDLGASSGDVFVLEMGEPVRILDLARNMITPGRLRARERRRDRVHRPPPGREDPRGAVQRRRARAADDGGAHRARRAGAARSTRPGWSARSSGSRRWSPPATRPGSPSAWSRWSPSESRTATATATESPASGTDVPR